MQWQCNQAYKDSVSTVKTLEVLQVLTNINTGLASMHYKVAKTSLHSKPNIPTVVILVFVTVTIFFKIMGHFD